MKKSFATLTLFLILGAAGYWAYSKLVKEKIPCTEPIPYALGDFDNRFDISQKYFLSALADAEAVWEKPSGRDLFAYAPEYSKPDVLKINLIYDYRQEATEKLSKLGITVKDSQASYDSLKAKFTALKSDYERKKIEFESHLAAWNRTPRTDRREYEELQAMQAELNEIVDEINALVVVLNRLAATLNLSVEKYNTINVARGESFEEGLYQSDGRTREINIYEFSSREKLVRVLAHELGHALEIDHVEDLKAIMYRLNQGNNMTLTGADLAALKLKCPAQ